MKYGIFWEERLIKSHVTPQEYKLFKLAANEVSASNDGLIFNR